MQDNRGGNFSTPEDDQEVQPELGRTVRSHPDDIHEDPGMIPDND